MCILCDKFVFTGFMDFMDSKCVVYWISNNQSLLFVLKVGLNLFAIVIGFKPNDLVNLKPKSLKTTKAT